MENLTKGLWNCNSRALRRVLQKWQRLNERLGSDWIKSDNNAPWWYNERASLGFFCGAVWLCGGWVFEEFITEKKPAGAKRTKRKYVGRCDIEFGIGKDEFLAEAKQCWPYIGTSTRKNIDRVESTINIACQESRQTPEPGYQKLGIVFAVPRLHKSKKERLDLELARFLNELKRLQHTTIAWVFPKSARNLMPSGESKNYVFPGVVLLIRRA
ncbi:MAG: hypothetical protein FJ009_13630 [Chloroflexi bacterium]|nr:hypothetical protein [Chloroflexota bacterium]